MKGPVCSNCGIYPRAIGEDACLMCLDKLREHEEKYGEGRDVVGTLVVVLAVLVIGAAYLFWAYAAK